MCIDDFSPFFKFYYFDRNYLFKHICRSAQILEDLLKRVSAVHERLRGMQQSYAALLYIVDAQQCEGYGEEYFCGKVFTF